MKMFDHWFLEFFSKTPWWMIPIAFFPCELWFVLEIMKGSNDLTTNIILTFGGMFFWTFAEYTLHRFFFHGEDTWMKQIPLNKYCYAFIFMIHGVHHSFPCDRYRLVFPPLIGYTIFYFLFFGPATYLFAPQTAYPLLLGFVIAYQFYDLAHYAQHHVSDPGEGSYLKKIKVYHMQHHYKHGNIGYGVSNKFWDIVFDTEIK
jgi:4-hydroxysphinganine ceramide fatty acyl 2-hydroxylase